MKTSKVILPAAVVLLLSNASATVRTLNNNNPSPGQYSNYSVIETASSNGDTIYVSGSPSNYGVITVNKQVTLIGTGHSPNKQNPNVSAFSTITLAGLSANSRFIGLNLFNFAGSAINTNNIYIARNIINGWISGSMAGNAWTIEGNIFNGTSGIILIGTNLTNAIIRNNIFNGQLSNLTSQTIVNNIFLGNGPAFTSTVTLCYIENNIFYRATPSGQNNNCTTAYNCSFPLTNLFTTDDDGSNIVANPMFINFPAAGDFFSYSYDFHLQAGSPCISNLGIDATQRGLFGAFPTNTFTMTGEPSIPQIRLMNVTPITVSVGQSINVNIISTTK